MRPVARGALGQWTSRTTFVLALAAGTVGLGSLWRFAWLMGSHGGSAFMLAYVLCVLCLAVPLLMAEVAVGVHGRGGPPRSLAFTADRSLLSRGWGMLGWLTCVAGLLLLMCHVVVIGWALEYTRMLNALELSDASGRLLGESFAALLAEPKRQYLWQGGFLGLLVLVSAQGVRRGLGIMVWLLVPALVTLLVALVWLALEQGNLGSARDYLFGTRPVDISGATYLAALGHALLTLGVGVGMGIVYGAYAPRRIPIGRSVFAVAVFDLVIALLAALAIFPLVFANNLEPAGGPGLLFISLPYAFGNMPQGEAQGVMFFAMIIIAAFGAALALLEPSVAAVRQGTGLPRPVAVLLVALVAWGGSTVISLSLAGQGWFARYNLLALFDQVAAGLLLPLLCLLLAALVGWGLDRRILREQFGRESDGFFSLWYALIRYIAPLALAAILLAKQFQ